MLQSYLDSLCVLQVLSWLERDDLRCNCSSACLEKSYQVDMSSSRWPAQHYEVTNILSFFSLFHCLLLDVGSNDLFRKFR